MAVRHPLLELVGSRYVQAQASSDELHLRALELIAAACVREWVDLPASARAQDVPAQEDVPPQPAWTQDSAPPVLQEAAEPQSQPPEAVANDDGESWWGSSPDETGPNPVRGSWDPPVRP